MSSSRRQRRWEICLFADSLYRPDLKVYFEKLTKPKIPTDTYPEYVSIDGAKKVYGTPSQLGNYVFESAIDFQTSYSIIYPQDTIWYNVGDGINVNSVGTFNILLDALDASCKLSMPWFATVWYSIYSRLYLRRWRQQEVRSSLP